MQRFRITCTVQTSSNPHKGHITSVGVEPPPNGLVSGAIVTVPTVYDMMDKGAVFYTVDDKGQEVEVVKYDCGQCGRPTLRTVNDDTTVNNLDELPPCQ